jgi:uncharacterized membrane protein
MRHSTSGVVYSFGLLPGGIQGGASGVSDDGKIVVGISASRAFRWTAASGMQLLPGSQAFAADISKDGKVIGGHVTSVNGIQASLWIDGMLTLLVDPTGNSHLVDVRDLNTDGSVVVGIASSPIGYPEAFRWSADGVARMGTLSDPYGVTGDGSIIVGGTISDGLGFRWASGSVIALPIGTMDTRAAGIGISIEGSVIVGYAGNQFSGTAARWHNGAIESLGDLPGGEVRAIANSCSSNGTVIVGSSHTGVSDPFGYNLEAFIWDRCNGMRNLKTVLQSELGVDLTGWILVSAEDISTDGRFVVGLAINPAGSHEPFLIELPGSIGDQDGDGICDNNDSCPSSDLNPTIVINGTDTGVTNSPTASGCTLGDMVNTLLSGNPSPNEVVPTITEWMQTRLISAQDMSRLVRFILKQ